MFYEANVLICLIVTRFNPVIQTIQTPLLFFFFFFDRNRGLCRLPLAVSIQPCFNPLYPFRRDWALAGAPAKIRIHFKKFHYLSSWILLTDEPFFQHVVHKFHNIRTLFNEKLILILIKKGTKGLDYLTNHYKTHQNKISSTLS